jgi:hypothetical protein
VRFAGLDVGRKVDRTALLVLDELRLVDCLLLEKMNFPRQLVALGDRLRRHSPLQRVAVDATGVGLPVADVLAYHGFPVLAVHIGSGMASHARLFGGLREAINGGDFSVAPDCPHRTLIKDELKALTGSYTPSGRGVHIAARQGHDDLAFALALAVHARRAGHGTQAHGCSSGRD